MPDERRFRQFITNLGQHLFGFLREVAIEIDSMPLEQKQPFKDLFVAMLAQSGMEKSVAPFTQSDEELEKLLSESAWWVLHKDITGEVKRSLLRFSREGRADRVDVYLCDYFRSDDLVRLRSKLQDWLAIPYLTDRKAILLDCLDAHSAGKYTLTIPALFPLIDGLTRRFRKDRLRSRKGIIAVGQFAQHYRRKEHKSWSASFEKFLRQIAYVSYDFQQGSPPNVLNRHGVLHGEIANYASEANSLKTFLVLDTVAQFAKAFYARPKDAGAAVPRRA